MAGLLSLLDLLDKEKLRQFADSLPTAEQNIDALKSGAMGLLGKAREGANSVVSGLSKMADDATVAGAGIRNQAMQAYQNYMQPQAPAPQRMGRDANAGAAPSEPRYLAPDQSGQLWTRAQIEAYYQKLHDDFYNNIDAQRGLLSAQ